MITPSGMNYNDNTQTFFGLSTNTKPTVGISNGSCFIEMDTSKIYFFDAAGEQWLEWGASA